MGRKLREGGGRREWGGGGGEGRDGLVGQWPMRVRKKGGVARRGRRGLTTGESERGIGVPSWSVVDMA